MTFINIDISIYVGTGRGVIEVRNADLDEAQHLTQPPSPIYVLRTGF